MPLVHVANTIQVRLVLWVIRGVVYSKTRDKRVFYTK